MPQNTLTMVDGTLASFIGGITDRSNQQRYDAMRQFCGTLRGTSAWGKARDGCHWMNDNAHKKGTSHPLFAVLFDICCATKRASIPTGW
jgi:hypothetical protein